jgi:glutamyl-tRNA synthetase
MSVRTRIAPSPTGDPHVGTAYVALFNLCFARSQGGQFILRIEDTDQARSTAESEQAILDSLRWLGIEWSEGPDVGGDYGPYRQSERSDIYRQYADQLVADKHAFHCFCSEDRLNELRAKQMAEKQTPGYDGHCMHLDAAQVKSKLASGESSVIRMKVPKEGVCTFEDYLRGPIQIDWHQIDMQVLMKADGLPTYHLANVVDDHLMKITHVIRGEEWINSAPKHQLLYRYFGWEMPVLCHMPLLRNPDKSKLSKRKNPTSIQYYRRMGYLPEAVLNYLGRMGWSMPDESERFTLSEMIEHFDIKRVSLGGPIFDVDKLSWLNANWIREALSLEEFAARVQEWNFNRDYFMQIAPLIKERISLFSDIVPLAGFFCSGMLDLNAGDFEHKSLEQDQCKRILQFTLWRLETEQDWDRDNLQAILNGLAERMELKIRDYLFPLFVAISGTAVSTSVYDSMAILGPDMTRTRLRHAVNVLGGLSKKQTKQWEKDYRVFIK